MLRGQRPAAECTLLIRRAWATVSAAAAKASPLPRSVHGAAAKEVARVRKEAPLAMFCAREALRLLRTTSEEELDAPEVEDEPPEDDEGEGGGEDGDSAPPPPTSPMVVEPAVAILTEADHAVIDAVQRAARQLHESARTGATPSTDDLPVDGAPGWRLRWKPRQSSTHAKGDVYFKPPTGTSLLRSVPEVRRLSLIHI